MKQKTKSMKNKENGKKDQNIRRAYLANRIHSSGVCTCGRRGNDIVLSPFVMFWQKGRRGSSGKILGSLVLPLLA